MLNYMLSYNDDKSKKYSGKPKDIFKSDKNFFKTTNTREDISKTTIFEVLSKISYRNKISKQPL